MWGSAAQWQAGRGNNPIQRDAWGSYQPFWGTEGFPQFGGGMMGMMANMGMGVAANSLMAPMGMTPMGMTDRNLYDRFQQQRLTNMHNTAMKSISEQERGSFMATMQGLVHLQGGTFGTEQRKAASTGFDKIVSSGMMPIMAQMAPEAMDQAMGSRGSASVMGEYMFRGGQMRVDPVSGKSGMDSAAVSGMTKQVFGNLYGGGRFKDREGIRAGQMGAAYYELQSRGMMPGQSTLAEFAGGSDQSGVLVEAMRRQGIATPGSLAGVGAGTQLNGNQKADLQKTLSNMAPSELSKLSQDTSVAPEIEKFDGKKVSETLKKYQGALSAMKDIFGEAGKPNAPMVELVNALEAFSGGALNQVDAGDLEKNVRTSFQMAQKAGLGFSGMQQMYAEGQNVAAQFGLNPAFSAQIAQNSIGFQGAYQAAGIGAHSQWGARDMNTMRRLDAESTARAMDSQSANQIGATYRLESLAGGDPSKMFKKGSRAAEWWEAVKGQRETFGADNSRVAMNTAQYQQMMAEGLNMPGVSSAQLAEMLTHQQQNQEQIHKNNVGSYVRGLQTGDLKDMGVWASSGSMAESLYGNAKDPTRRGQLAQKTSEDVMGMFFGPNAMSKAQFADTKKRTNIVGEAIRRSMMESDEGKAKLAEVRGTGSAQEQGARERQFLATQAEQMYGNLTESDDYAAFGGFVAAFDMNEKNLTRDRNRRKVEGAAGASIQKAFAGVGRGGAMQRIADAIQTVKPGDEDALQKALGKAFGGVEGKEISKILTQKGSDGSKSAYQKVVEDQQKIKDLEQLLTAEKDPVKRDQLFKQLDVLGSGLGGHITEMKQVLEANNIQLVSPVKKADLDQSARAQAWVSREVTRMSGKTADDKKEMDLSFLTDDQKKDLEGIANKGGGWLNNAMSLTKGGLDEWLDKGDGSKLSDAEKKKMRDAHGQYGQRLKKGMNRADQQMADLVSQVANNEEAMLRGGQKARDMVQDFDSARMERKRLVEASGGEAEYMRKVAHNKEMQSKEKELLGRMDKARTFMGDMEAGKGEKYEWLGGDKDKVAEALKQKGATLNDLKDFDLKDLEKDGLFGSLDDASKATLKKAITAKDAEVAKNRDIAEGREKKGRDLMKSWIGKAKGKALSDEDFDDLVSQDKGLQGILDQATGTGSHALDVQASLRNSMSSDDKTAKLKKALDGGSVDELDGAAGVGGVMEKMLGPVLKEEKGADAQQGDAATGRMMIKVMELKVNGKSLGQADGESVQETSGTTDTKGAT